QCSPMRRGPLSIERPGLSQQQSASTNAADLLCFARSHTDPIESCLVTQEGARAAAARNDEKINRRGCAEAVARNHLQITSCGDGFFLLATVKTRKGAVSS